MTDVRVRVKFTSERDGSFLTFKLYSLGTIAPSDAIRSILEVFRVECRKKNADFFGEMKEIMAGMASEEKEIN